MIFELRIRYLTLSLLFTSAAPQIGGATTTIPFVGCANDGQPNTAPSGQPLTINIPKIVGARLALYAGVNLAVLAPRGWTCEGDESDNLISLFVSPAGGDPHTGPAIIIESRSRENAFGNIIITSYVERYFPKFANQRDVASIFSDNPSLTKSDLLAPSYKTDKISYRNSSIMEFQTPSNREGLGSDIFDGSRFRSSDAVSHFPTHGLIGLRNQPIPSYQIYLAAIRLPTALIIDEPYILRFIAECVEGGTMAFCPSVTIYPDANK